MDWYDLTDRYHSRTLPHECRLSSLPCDWQRELAALSRLEGDVNNGGYLQFFANSGRETYEYASQALKKIGATKMADIVDRCQALVDEHFDAEGKSDEDSNRLLPNKIIDAKSGAVIKEAGSVLPESVVARLYELSLQEVHRDTRMTLPRLGLNYYRAKFESDLE